MTRSQRVLAAVVGLWLLEPSSALGEREGIEVGSKKFTESVILAELACAVLAGDGDPAPRHRAELGGTQVLWKALQRGDIDVYPEYSGTLARQVLHSPNITRDDMRARLRARGIGMGEPLGFDNTYALGMREARARALDLTTISALRQHPDLRLGFTSEFMHRADGWPGLQAHYRLPQREVRGLDHDLAYRGLVAKTLDVIDLYSTDAEIAYYGLRVLRDDRAFFPAYEAVYLYRLDLPPARVRRLATLAGSIDEATMRSLNAEVKLAGKGEAAVARRFLADRGVSVGGHGGDTSAGAQLFQHTADHLLLVAISLSAGIAIAMPLGILAARRRRLSQVVLGASSVLQTIPSLALLVMMIPLLGIGAPPAIAALFLYSLLPIVRNTYAGLTQIPTSLIESADALGLDQAARLRLIELPLATPSILAGIKTAAVINVGTATLGALVGAGGYGQPILTGIRLDDVGLIMQGAVPAAMLALLVQWAFDLVEHRLTGHALKRRDSG